MRFHFAIGLRVCIIAGLFDTLCTSVWGVGVIGIPLRNKFVIWQNKLCQVMGRTTCKQFIVSYNTFFSVLSYSYGKQLIVSNNKCNQPKQFIVLFIFFKQFILS